MLSTLYAHADVPASDAELLRRLRPLLLGPIDESTATMYRLAIVNEAGAAYRLVIDFGERKRTLAMQALDALGYRCDGPQPERGLDAIFHPPPSRAA
jgi:hypothetical protein